MKPFSQDGNYKSPLRGGDEGVGKRMVSSSEARSQTEFVNIMVERSYAVSSQQLGI